MPHPGSSRFALTKPVAGIPAPIGAAAG